MPRPTPVSPPLLGMVLVFAALSACSTAVPPPSAGPAPRGISLRDLAVSLAGGENRPVSFTNKRSAYYYTQTLRNDHPEHAWFRGLNIAGRRVFNDYHLTVGGRVLDPAAARAVVRPDALIRSYPAGETETLRLFDDRDVIEVDVTGARAPVALRLSGDRLRAAGADAGVDWYVSTTPTQPPVADTIAVGRSGGRFLIAVGGTRAAALALLRDAEAHAPQWAAERRARLESLLSGDHYLWTDDPSVTTALRWITLTTDELVTHQGGDGIYAGLPWFNEYWGRDSFISLAGATLVTGHFEAARAILESFARFQDLDRTSPFYGRLPNIVKPGSIDYHTTDGTPRWVIALRDYVRYSGDRSILPELYPHVVASIEGSFARWTDTTGYLVHADNETWMDARRSPDLVPYSPRGTRANDIQALWYEQLRAGAEFAGVMGDTTLATRWTHAAERLRLHFVRDFVDARTGRIADRLDARNVPDFTLRPNFLFALDLLADREAAARATRTGWEALVYPWGVATLDQANPFFHPYHLAWEQYHKDEAYHNGTVWPWLNGIAMQRMIEDGQTELAWQLFRAMDDLALGRGVVGGLPETMDAYPHPGESRPRLTGTFLQAWSNAEQLRVWYQYLLGVRPDMTNDRVLLAPRLPAGLNAVEFTARIGRGAIHARFERSDGARRLEYRLAGQTATLVMDVSPYEVGTFPAAAGDVLTAEIRPDGLHVRLESARGSPKETVVLRASPARMREQGALDAILAGTRFAQPGDAAAHPVMKQVYRRGDGR